MVKATKRQKGVMSGLAGLSLRSGIGRALIWSEVLHLSDEKKLARGDDEDTFQLCLPCGAVGDKLVVMKVRHGSTDRHMTTY